MERFFPPVEETVHVSRMKEQLSFEVSVNRSEMLSLFKEITPQ